MEALPLTFLCHMTCCITSSWYICTFKVSYFTFVLCVDIVKTECIQICWIFNEDDPTSGALLQFYFNFFPGGTPDTCPWILYRALSQLALGQTFFILWFTDIFAPCRMSGFGIKIKIKFLWCQSYLGCQARKSLFWAILRNKIFRMTEN